ncbi:MAG: hypothetical protein C5S44_06365 [Candidatus Methanocomedens sp.]|nr:MAG: hypothetical protein C5S44_06365 [ANME-2 cluster archaeon]
MKPSHPIMKNRLNKLNAYLRLNKNMGFLQSDNAIKN